MTKKEIAIFFVALIVGTIIIIAVSTYLFCKINTPEKMLVEINQTMQAYNPRHGFSVPEDQKTACIEWAYGKDWKNIQWSNRADRFRDLHPELNPNDFSDATHILLYNERVSLAYLERKR